MARIITPEDYAELRTQIEEKLPENEVAGFYKLMEVLGNGMFPRYGSTGIYPPEHVKKIALIYSSTLQMWNGFTIKPQQISDFTFLLDDGTLDIYLSLTPECQKFCLDLIEIYRPFIMYVYLRIFQKLRHAPPVRLIRVRRELMFEFLPDDEKLTVSENFIKALESTDESKALHEADYSLPSKAFLAKVCDQGSNFESLDDSKAELMFLLRIVYGESALMEFITASESSGDRLSWRQVMGVLDDWENLKNYPIQWSVNVIPSTSGSEIRDYFEAFARNPKEHSLIIQ